MTDGGAKTKANTVSNAVTTVSKPSRDEYQPGGDRTGHRGVVRREAVVCGAVHEQQRVRHRDVRAFLDRVDDRMAHRYAAMAPMPIPQRARHPPSEHCVGQLTSVGSELPHLPAPLFRVPVYQ